MKNGMITIRWAVILGCIAAGLILAVVSLSWFQTKDLKDAIAAAVNGDVDAIILNLPPSGARFPGSILAPYENRLLIYEAVNSPSDDTIVGKSFDISAKLDNDVDVLGGLDEQLLSLAVQDKTNLEVLFQIKNGQILDLPIPKLKEIVATNSDNRSFNNSLIVTRSYVGNVRYTLKAKTAVGVETVGKISNTLENLADQRAEISFKDQVSSENQVSFEQTEPVVFAFELAKVNYVATELSVAESEVNITPISSRRLKRMFDDRSSKVSPTTPSDGAMVKPAWGLVIISSAYYENFPKLDAPESNVGAAIFKDVLSEYEPAFVKELISSKNTPITDQLLLDWTIDLTTELLVKPVDHLLVYYTGHGFSLPSGELAIIQSNISKDFAEKSQNANTISTAELGDGILLVETLHSAIGASGVPYTLFMDTCYPNEEMQEALTRVNMLLGSRSGENLLYYGDKPLITNELTDIAQVMREIGNRFPYRQGSNAVIFSSKPGARSVFVPNPIDRFGLNVPPLAARIAARSQYADIQSADSNLALLLRSSVDFVGGVGQISMSGTITWSDLTPMLTTLEKASRRGN